MKLADQTAWYITFYSLPDMSSLVVLVIGY